jgi:two-component system chemotaxis sensor kinase CheA
LESAVTKILIVKAANKVYGIIVDSICDREDVLVKPLPQYLRNCQVYSGATILGDGKVAMVLSLDNLVPTSALSVAEEQLEALRPNEEIIQTLRPTLQEVLLFKCSGPEIFTASMPLVARMEIIQPGQIQMIGNKEYVKCGGNVLRVIRPEEYLPVQRCLSERSKLYLIVPKFVTKPLGIVVEKTLGTIHSEIKIDEEHLQAKGLLGTTVINNTITLMVDLHELIELAAPEYLMTINDREGLTV